MSRTAQTHDEIGPARPFQFTGRIRSFYHAICGILRMIRCQHHAWVHAFATLAVLFAAFFFRISDPAG
jgi:diacylglycerol kinase